MKITLNCLHCDTCLPDYWSGHHLAHISVPVHRGMSAAAVRAALRDELRQGAVCGHDDIARMLSADLVAPEDESRTDAVTRAAYAAINRDVRPAEKGARRLFLDLEPEETDSDDCRESVYAYFVFAERDA